MADTNKENSFRIYYRGGLAEKGLLNAEDFAESLMGAARLYGVLAHYSVLGYVPRKHKQVEVYTKATTQGSSVDLELVIQGIGAAAAIATFLIAYATEYWRKPPAERNRTTERYADILLERERNLGKLLDVQMALVNKLPKVAEAAHPHLQGLAKPLERASCESIVQLPGTREQTILTQEDVPVIYTGSMVTEQVEALTFVKIQRVNTATRNCSVVIDDDDWHTHGVVFGEIEDKNLELANNDYTRAMNLQLGGIVFARLRLVAGRITRLYIKGILVDDTEGDS